MSSINPNISKRIRWKEFREFRGLLFAMGIIFIIVIVLQLVSSEFYFGNTSVGRNLMGSLDDSFLMYGFFVNTLALLVGVVLFAAERDNRTTGMLSSLPASNWLIARSKLFAGLLLIFAFGVFCFAVRSVATYVVVHQVVESPGPGIPSLFFGLTLFEIAECFLRPLECFLWGVFWSLFMKRTVYALIMAIVSLLLISGFGGFVVPELLGFQPTSALSTYTDWIIRAVAVVAILFPIRAIASSWLLDSTPKTQSQRSPAMPVSSVKRVPTRGRGVLRVLIWQSFRQATPVLIGAAICLASLVIAQFFLPVMVLLPVLILVPVLAAGFAFYFDNQNNSMRFFQEQAEHGRTLWLARLLPVALIAICSIFIGGIWSMADLLELIASNYRFHYGNFHEYHVSILEHFVAHITPVRIGITIFCSVAIAQFFSMFEKTILSFLLGVVFSAAMLCWCALIIFVDASFWIFVAPFGATLFLATWMQAPRWLADKSQFFDKAFVWLSFGGTAVLTLFTFCLYRANEVPPIPASRDPIYSELVSLYESNGESVSPSRSETANELKTLKSENSGLRKVISRVRESPAETVDIATTELSLHKDRLAALHDTLNYLDSAFLRRTFGVSSPELCRERFHQDQLLLELDFIMQMNRGELDSALKSIKALNEIETHTAYFTSNHKALPLFIDWSSHPDQTSASIRSGLQYLVENRSSGRERFYAHASLINQINRLSDPEKTNPLFRLIYSLPWERERLRRLSYHVAEHAMTWQILDQKKLRNNPESFIENLDETRKSFTPSPLLAKARTSPILMMASPFEASSSHWSQIQLLRYTKIRMALDAYRVDNGRYPDALWQLVSGTQGANGYLAWLPKDILSGDDFAYSGVGLDFPIHVTKYDGPNPSPSDYVHVDELILNGPFLLPWAVEDTNKISTRTIRMDEDQKGLDQANVTSEPSIFRNAVPVLNFTQNSSVRSWGSLMPDVADYRLVPVDEEANPDTEARNE